MSFLTLTDLGVVGPRRPVARPVNHKPQGLFGLGGLFGMGEPTTDIANGTNIQFVEIPDGIEGTAATIGEMRRVAIEGAKNPKIIALARSIVRDVPSRDYVGEARRVYEWVRDNIKYRLDPHTPPLSLGDSDYLADYIQTPEETLRVRQGDCDDHSTLLGSLMMALGKGAAVRTVNADSRRPEQASHVYALAGLRKAGQTLWIPMDTTEPQRPFGWEAKAPRAWGHKTWVFASP